MAVKERAGLECNACAQSIHIRTESRKRLVCIVVQFEGVHEQFVYFICCQIHTVGDAECLKAGKMESVGIIWHKSDRVDADLVICFLVLFFVEALLRRLVLVNFSEEQALCRVNYDEIADGVRKKRALELASVVHRGDVLDQRNGVASVNLSNLTQIVFLQIIAFKKRFKCHSYPPANSDFSRSA